MWFGVKGFCVRFQLFLLNDTKKHDGDTLEAQLLYKLPDALSSDQRFGA